ncbi:type II and III secretion system protein family protein [Bradyrhizobium jicamae]|nr:type II and III secretion system protein family protein [Bradyrhizobium jicamae]
MDQHRGARKARRKLLAFGLVVAAMPWSSTLDGAAAADRKSEIENGIIADASDVHRVTVIVNKSKTFRLERPFASIVAGSPDIADVKALGDRTIYVLGKQTGTTNVVFFDDQSRQIAVLDVQVMIDTANLQQNIASATGARGIRVSASEGQIVLGGTVTDAVVAERAMSIATGTVPKGAVVVNAMNVAAPQQVMLEVRFLEVNRTAGRQLGVNLYGGNSAGNQLVNTGLGAGGSNGAITQTQPGSATGGLSGIPLLGTASTLAGSAVPFGNVLTNVINQGGNRLDVLITALETKGLVRRLAEPNLIALSGDAARFLAGGEFPVPVASTAVAGALPTVTIEFKKFGVELGFVPTVLSRGIINLRIEPSVSELDFTNAVSIAGTTIPALTRRDARTTVELRDGQSFAIAGLLQNRNQQDISQLPWIGSVPVLGTLFSSKSYLQNETDLVIIVTPHLVAPAAPGQALATPLDSRLPANDVDFFLNGQMEVKKRYNDYVNSGGDIKGPYGHLIGPEVRGVIAPQPVAVEQPVVKTLN